MTSMEWAEHQAFSYGGLLTLSLSLEDEGRVLLKWTCPDEAGDDSTLLGHIEDSGTALACPPDLWDSLEELREDWNDSARFADACRDECRWSYEEGRYR